MKHHSVVFLLLFSCMLGYAAVPFSDVKRARDVFSPGNDDTYFDSGIDADNEAGITLSRKEKKEIRSVVMADSLHYWTMEMDNKPYLFSLDTASGAHSYYILCVHDFYVDKYKSIANDKKELIQLYVNVKELCDFLDVYKEKFLIVCYRRMFRLKKNIGNRILHLKKKEERNADIEEAILDV
ncbi:MAG: hypothetical protein MJZ23_04940 [Paludibacteraceae bacterium]|nr:hypothetical protein [Paludibacteraceae bacterium]